MRKRLLPVAAVAVAAAATLSACTSATVSGTPTGSTTVPGSSGSSSRPVTPSSGSSGSSSSSSSSSAAASGPTTPVQISLINADNSTYGVGMPIIAYFSRRITNATALEQATTVKVNGRLEHGAWFFETSSAGHGPIEGHFRLQHPWPANSHVYVNMPVKGLSAGGHMVYSDSLFSTWRTGDSHISTVSNARHTITVTDNGKTYGTFPVSLGAESTPTRRGTKVIMEQVPTVCMQDVDDTYHECGIKWDQRLTYDGEYLHAAPWNCTSGAGCTGPHNNIGYANSSNGCTNLKPATAEQLFRFMRVGDIVRYPDADGRKMKLGDGYGDWNVSWTTWRTGGLVRTS